MRKMFPCHDVSWQKTTIGRCSSESALSPDKSLLRTVVHPVHSINWFIQISLESYEHFRLSNFVLNVYWFTPSLTNNSLEIYRSNWFTYSCIWETTLFWNIMTSSNGNISLVPSPLWGESIVDRWIPLAKPSDAELWRFLWSAPEEALEQTIETPVVWDAMALILTPLQWNMLSKLLIPRTPGWN